MAVTFGSLALLTFLEGCFVEYALEEFSWEQVEDVADDLRRAVG